MLVLGTLLTFCLPKMLSWAVNVSYILGVLRDLSGYLGLEEGVILHRSDKHLCRQGLCRDGKHDNKHVTMLEAVGKECVIKEVAFTIYEAFHCGRCLFCDTQSKSLELGFFHPAVAFICSSCPSSPFPPPPFILPLLLSLTLCVCLGGHMCMGVCKCVNMPEEDVRCLQLSLPTLVPWESCSVNFMSPSHLGWISRSLLGSAHLDAAFISTRGHSWVIFKMLFDNYLETQ